MAATGVMLLTEAPELDLFGLVSPTLLLGVGLGLIVVSGLLRFGSKRAGNSDGAYYAQTAAWILGVLGVLGVAISIFGTD